MAARAVRFRRLAVASAVCLAASLLAAAWGAGGTSEVAQDAGLVGSLVFACSTGGLWGEAWVATVRHEYGDEDIAGF